MIEEIVEGVEGRGLEAEDSAALLESLVSIPSTSYNEHDAVTYLTRWMADHGAAAHVDAAGNAVGIFGSGERDIVLLGHIDTVGGFPEVRREGSLLYGRGSVDAKGALCTFAAATTSARIPDGWRVVVIGAVEEECPTSAGAHYAMTQFSPELCVIGEPSRWDRITLGYKGRLIADFDLTVPISHSASRAETAAEHAVDVWSRIRAFADTYNAGRERAFDRLDATLMRMNTSDDGLHGYAQMRVGFRLPIHVAPQGLERELRALLVGQQPLASSKYAADTLDPSLVTHHSSSTDRPYTVNTVFSSHTVTYAAPRDTAISRLFRAAIREHGGTPAFVMKTGTSDMNIAGPVWGCPVLAYGPGDSALDHTPNEHIDLDEYQRAISILAHVIEHLHTAPIIERKGQD